MSSRWYPIYQRGNPQLRVFLPNLWMKLVKPTAVFGKATVPENKVQFIVSREMSKIDIKNYLEKVYNVPVAHVKTVNKLGKTKQNAFADYIVKDEDFKVAFVTLPQGMKCRDLVKIWLLCLGHKFEWPELKIGDSDKKLTEGSEEDVDNAKKQFAKDVKAEDVKFRPGVPSFFGL